MYIITYSYYYEREFKILIKPIHYLLFFSYFFIFFHIFSYSKIKFIESVKACKKVYKKIV